MLKLSAGWRKRMNLKKMFSVETDDLSLCFHECYEFLIGLCMILSSLIILLCLDDFQPSLF